MGTGYRLDLTTTGGRRLRRTPVGLRAAGPGSAASWTGTAGVATVAMAAFMLVGPRRPQHQPGIGGTADGPASGDTRRTVRRNTGSLVGTPSSRAWCASWPTGTASTLPGLAHYLAEYGLQTVKLPSGWKYSTSCRSTLRKPTDR